MDHSRGVRRGESVGDRDGPPEHLARRQTPGRDELREGLPRDVLGDDEVDAALGPDLVNCEDVRVGEGRGGPRLPGEALAPVRIGGFPGGEDLHGDETPETGIPRLVDDAHASLADLLDELVVRQSVHLGSASILGRRRTAYDSPEWTRA